MPRSDGLLPGFDVTDLQVGEVTLHAAIGGTGPPLLLLHGHPQNHLTWHKIAPDLARHYTVVAADLRGYGDSSTPDGGARSINYSKRVMAQDCLDLMSGLGFSEFAVVGHDRGARVAHRLVRDHPAAITSCVLLDIAPTATMYARTDREFATRYFWWFLLIQPAELPERLLAADPDYFLDRHLDGQSQSPDTFDARVRADYRRCYRNAAVRHAICEDYRASAGIDLDHDRDDAGTLTDVPLLVLWGALGTVGQLYDVLGTWREVATNVRGRSLECGHNLQEERPQELLAELEAFLADPS